MKHQTFTEPNSLDCAIDAIDESVARGVLTRMSGTVLKLLYLWGWDDGFASIPRTDASLIFGLCDVEIARSLRQLASFGFLRLREAGERHTIEITALSGCAMTSGLPLSWWRYYKVDVGSQTE